MKYDGEVYVEYTCCDDNDDSGREKHVMWECNDNDYHHYDNSIVGALIAMLLLLICVVSALCVCFYCIHHHHNKNYTHNRRVPLSSYEYDNWQVCLACSDKEKSMEPNNYMGCSESHAFMGSDTADLGKWYDVNAHKYVKYLPLCENTMMIFLL